MTLKKITYADLEALLMEIGFSVGCTTGHHRLFEYPDFDSVILLPARRPDESVAAAHLVAVRKHVTDKGIIDTSTFDAMVEMHRKTDRQPVLLPEG